MSPQARLCARPRTWSRADGQGRWSDERLGARRLIRPTPGEVAFGGVRKGNAPSPRCQAAGGRRTGVYGAVLLAAYDSDAGVFRAITKCDADLAALPARLAPLLSSQKPARVGAR
jgi:hypothetical protein